MTSISSRLHADTRGAMLVIGIAMGILLVGALYNIVSVGDAILWREHMQDTADAAAFEASVWQARGMNVIAFMNMLMAAAMAVLVAVRGIIILTSVVLVALSAASAACLLAFLPVGITQALCVLGATARPVVQSANTWAVRAEQRIAPRVNRFLETVQTAQSVVATVTPLIAAREASVRNTAEFETVAFALGPSMLMPTTSDGARARLDVGFDRSAMIRIGRGLSLPVSLDGDFKLCEKAGQFLPNEILAVTEATGLSNGTLDAAGGFMRSLLGGITGSLPALFCGEKSPDEVASIQDIIRQSADDGCRAAEERGRVPSSASDADREQFGRYQDYWQRQSPIVVDARGNAETHGFDRAKCRRDEIARQNQAYDASKLKGYKTARVWRYTLNGDLFMQNWGFSYGAPPRLEPNDQGLIFPTGGDRGTLQPSDVSGFGLERFAFAQAEMYHDCATPWVECGLDAMWRMAWKARMRRVQNPVDLAARSVANIAQAELVNGLHRLLVTLTNRLDVRIGTALGNGRGGPAELIANVLRGNLWDTAYFNRGNVLGTDPLGAAANTITQHLAAHPPLPGEQYIH
ncbi:MAG: hypothetical protein ABW252_05785 [Polyangiales bacterium]